MLTKEDKGWMVENFVTRGEHRADITRLEAAYEKMDGNFDTVMKKLDGIAASIGHVRQENDLGSVVIARHTRQIEAIAHKTHVTLSE